ncbi:hypothetical protein AVMA1855_06090 [Acidovorax sp. SUPP1855]|uniref:hypothetical protein n=1 Tax=Acidovorax sp. SUPP1855 TaxID=431774 RepID=UPI0023DE5CAD|nr:hypothetical protein [Acidovorax sp. SUPP1855]GKS83692.1 hypothetical protein AVMA1855_06090 [Acidovorax sp. SUPP1855]
MIIKEIPNAKDQIKRIIQQICQNDIASLEEAELLDDKESRPGIEDFIEDYLSNPRNSLKNFDPPPEDEISKSETRKGWNEFDILADIDLWANHQKTDATAIFRIRIDPSSKTSTVKLYDLRVL